ncbi:hypothetical protein [Phytoactinopolyspora alkaliphila]|uniref:hypothetical protein n=1 Tax=Phytoactinopolyspora alkaliphila TaxID=1783498 RepID=UPI001C203AD6|nr:hypothetical protein [Phytoactinopolyspora alkaliphila]
MAETRTDQSAHFDSSMSGVVVKHVVISDTDVVREAQRWTTGKRGSIVDDPSVLVNANLAEFVTEAVTIGAHALSAVGQTQEAKSLEQMIKELGDRTARTTNEAVEITERAAKQASDAVNNAADTAGKALRDAEGRARKELTNAVASVKSDLSTELRQVFGGENPALVERLQPILDQFGTRLDARVGTSTGDLIAKVGRQFDPADPTSPMAKHQAALEAQRHELAEHLAANHKELTSKVDELTTALKIGRRRMPWQASPRSRATLMPTRFMLS